MWLEEQQRQIAPAHDALVAEGLLEPLGRDTADVRLWTGCQLASMVENRCHVPLDPRTLTREVRDRWKGRAVAQDERLEDPHDNAWIAVQYWIVEGGPRVGTLALGTTFTGMGFVAVSSLYVLPENRRRGVATRALRRTASVVAARSGASGLRVPTHWTWQAAVRHYLGMGLWVVSWKHSLVFALCDDFPEWRAEVEEGEARFRIGTGNSAATLITARRDGERLEWRETPAFAEWRARGGDTILGIATFSLVLAVRGWPLIRSAETWAARHLSSDLGEPEGLAYKIQVFEALDRRCGFDVRTPRLPGLAYPDLHEID